MQQMLQKNKKPAIWRAKCLILWLAENDSSENWAFELSLL